MSTAEMAPPKPVQRWSADDYAHKGRFVSELARPAVDLLAPKRGERILDLGCGDGVRPRRSPLPAPMCLAPISPRSC
jgi:hypothetical protein